MIYSLVRSIELAMNHNILVYTLEYILDRPWTRTNDRTVHLILDSREQFIPDIHSGYKHIIFAFYSGSFREFFGKIKGFPFPVTPEGIILRRNSAEFYGKMYCT